MTELRNKIAALINQNLPEDYDAGFQAADAIIAALPDILPDMVPPLVWDGWDGGLTCAHTSRGQYILGSDLRLSLPNQLSLRRYETEASAIAAANAHNAAAVGAALTGAKP